MLPLSHSEQQLTAFVQPQEQRSVRSQVAEMTQDAHEALHVHPVLGRLLSPNIVAAEYHGILLAHLSFYQAAENARVFFTLLPSLSFTPELHSLRKDIAYDGDLQPEALPISSRHEALGMLYVLYGSRFGAKTILRNLRSALPDKRHSFFDRRACKYQWNVLLEALEEAKNQPARISELVLGSKRTFREFDRRMGAAGNPTAGPR